MTRKVRYAKFLGSALNPVLMEGNSDISFSRPNTPPPNVMKVIEDILSIMLIGKIPKSSSKRFYRLILISFRRKLTGIYVR